MALNIKNLEVERLASDIARLAHETKTEAIRRALLERKARLQARGAGRNSRRGLREYLQRNVWPLIPPAQLGRVLTRDEEEEILGYGPEGV